jgi:hypothetical protein
MARRKEEKEKPEAQQLPIPLEGERKPEAQPEELHIFPQQLRAGDIVTDHQGTEWEVIGNPTVYQQGKSHQVRVQKPGNPTIKSINFYPAHERVAVKRGREVTPTRATASATRTELLVRDGEGKLVYRFTLPCDPVADPGYLKALVAGEQVAAIACERPGTANVFYAKTLDELKAWAAQVRGGDGQP